MSTMFVLAFLLLACGYENNTEIVCYDVPISCGDSHPIYCMAYSKYAVKHSDYSNAECWYQTMDNESSCVYGNDTCIRFDIEDCDEYSDQDEENIMGLLSYCDRQ